MYFILCFSLFQEIVHEVKVSTLSGMLTVYLKTRLRFLPEFMMPVVNPLFSIPELSIFSRRHSVLTALISREDEHFQSEFSSYV